METQAQKHSRKFYAVKGYYDTGRWNAAAVNLACERGWITEEERNEILDPGAER